VRLVVGYAPGGATDITARVIAERLSERFGQQFFVENRPGAATNIATEQVVRSPPDGYTLLVASGANAINATLYDNLNFDFLRDMAPVAGIIGMQNVLEVHPAVPANTIPELIAYAKANPDRLIAGSAGNGSPGHVSAELFKMLTGTKMLHAPIAASRRRLRTCSAGGFMCSSTTWRPRSSTFTAAGCARSGSRRWSVRRCCRTCRRSANPFPATTRAPGMA
jgi:tripartite-type tricarboxylate transporter receptor subunit TctC